MFMFTFVIGVASFIGAVTNGVAPTDAGFGTTIMVGFLDLLWWLRR